jgi:hypothetical protein
VKPSPEQLAASTPPNENQHFAPEGGGVLLWPADKPSGEVAIAM